MLCYIKGASALGNSYFGFSRAPHILSDVKCRSYENYTSLLRCPHNTIDATIYCGDSAIASVICVGNTFTLYASFIYSHVFTYRRLY